MSKELVEGRWYWVEVEKDGEPHFFAARHDPKCANGWTNDDTWEDFDGQVIGWEHMPTPAEIRAAKKLVATVSIGEELRRVLADMEEIHESMLCVGGGSATVRGEYLTAMGFNFGRCINRCKSLFRKLSL